MLNQQSEKQSIHREFKAETKAKSKVQSKSKSGSSGIKEYQLKNGLKVLLQESRKSPVVSMQAWVRTGSADETPAEAGLSHFIEHLLFKGTRKFKVGEIAQVIEGSGGELNAYTSFDQTVFYMTLSSKYMRTGLEALSDMMGFPTFDADEIHSEREVVVEEMRRGQDSLGRQASQLLFKSAFRNHPYGRPVIGTEKVVRSVSPKKLKSFFQSRYTPRNMFLLLSGDFETVEAKAMIEELFGELKDYPLKKVKRPKVEIGKKPRIVVEKSTFEQSLTYLTWPIPKLTHKDIPALDLLAFVLGAGESSRLVQRLRMKEPLVQSIGTSTFTPQEGGLFLLSFSETESDLPKILSAILEEFARFLKDGISSDEIKRALTNLQSDEFYSMETVDGLARKLGNLEFYYRDINATEKFMKQMRELTSNDLQRVFRKYLIPDGAVLTSYSKKAPEVVKKHLEQFLKQMEELLTAKKPKATAPKAIRHAKLPKFKAVREEPEIQVFDLPNGDRVLYRPSFETPVVSIRAAALGGIRHEAADKAGLTELTTRVWGGGTTKRTEEEISIEMETIAASVSPSGGRNSISLSADYLASYSDQALDLFMDLAENPTFPDEVMQRERQLLLQQIKSKKDNPATICVNLFMKAMYGNHPYSRDPLGEPAKLADLTRSDLSDWWKKNFLGGRRVLAICGAESPEKWIKAWGQIKKSGKPETAKHTVTPLNSEVRVFEKAEKEQTNLIIGYPGLTMKDEDRYALQVIQSILAGQGGRLFLELRDKNSLAYSVSPLRMEGLEAGYFGAYIGCAPDKLSTAARMMKEQFMRLVDEKVPTEEMDRAKRYIVGRHDIDLQRSGSVAGAIVFNSLYGMDHNEAFTSAEKYWSVTADQIRALAKKIFEAPAVISVVGPAPLVD